MNLNKAHKQAIVMAVMADVPRARKDPSGDAQKIMDADIAKHAPKEVAAIWKNKELACYLDLDSDPIAAIATDLKDSPRYHGPLQHVQVRFPRLHTASAKCVEQFNTLFAEMLGEAQAVEAASAALTGAIYGIRTVKAFVAQFPELAKYAPAEPTMGTNLPAIANVMADLSKLGWPKSKEVAA
jgi:hypothetical protein